MTFYFSFSSIRRCISCVVILWTTFKRPKRGYLRGSEDEIHPIVLDVERAIGEIHPA
jgi:hypothetical protein